MIVHITSTADPCPANYAMPARGKVSTVPVRMMLESFLSICALYLVLGCTVWYTEDVV